MNWIDIALVVPLIWGFIKGFKKGLIIELVSIIALIAGIYAGMHLSYLVTPYLEDKVPETYLHLVSFIITFILVVLGLYLIGKLLEKIVDIIQLGFLNKMAGSAFGAIKFLIITSVIFYFAAQIGLFKPEESSSPIVYFYTEVGNLIVPAFRELNINELSPESLKKATDLPLDSLNLIAL